MELIDQELPGTAGQGNSEEKVDGYIIHQAMVMVVVVVEHLQLEVEVKTGPRNPRWRWCGYIQWYIGSSVIYAAGGDGGPGGPG